MSSFHRRGFLGGALALVMGRGRASANQAGTTPEQRLAELGLELPPAPTPGGTYVPSVRSGSMLYVSGSGPGVGPDGEPVRGKVGRDLTLEQGNAAARLAGLRILANVRHSLGSLDKVERLVKVLGMVNATPDFGQQPRSSTDSATSWSRSSATSAAKAPAARWGWALYRAASP